ncbi:MAG: hypothetical protein WBD86_01295 [Microgenomates group bacterium]
MEPTDSQERGFSLCIDRIRQKLPKWPIHIWLFVLVLTLTIISTGLYLYLSPSLKQKLVQRFGPKPSPEPQNIWAPAKPSPAPLAHGKQTYMVSGSTKGAPKMSEVIIDPLDPKPEETQTVTIKALDVNKSPIKEITVTLVTDNKSESHTLKRINGTDLNGTWQGSWKISDSYDYTYRATLKAKNEANLVQSVTLTFR